METAPENLKGKNVMLRLKINDKYDEVKQKLEARHVNLESVFFTQVGPDGKEIDQPVLPT